MALLSSISSKCKILIVSLFALLFSSCEIDPCANTNCENGGYCIEGTCNCPVGYSGKFCQDKLVPIWFNISKIEIISFPATKPNGYSWDGGIYAGSGPADLVVKLFNENSVVAYTNTVNDATFGATLFFSDIFYLPIDNKITIELHDRDSPTQGEFMGGYYFYASQYPSTPHFIDLYNDNTPNLKMRVFVQWFY